MSEPRPLLDATDELAIVVGLLRALELSMQGAARPDDESIALGAIVIAMRERIERALEFVEMARGCRARAAP